MRGEGFQTPTPIHITGAEGLYKDNELVRVVRDYAIRALTHPKGKSDKVVITLEGLKENPRALKALPVCTLRCDSPSEAKRIVTMILRRLAISEDAIKTGFSILRGKETMRGAAIVSKESGVRLEPDKARGVRASRMGIEKKTLKSLSVRLSRHGLNRDTVKEAIILATKVAVHPDVRAELCISDDPDYSTGYVASRDLGYLRIPNIKNNGSKQGGRVFFVNEDADMPALLNYLELCPVLIRGLSKIKGTVLPDEILNSPHR